MNDHNPATLIVHQFPCLSDNYGYLVHDNSMGITASIDTPDATEIENQLHLKGWSLDYIFNTHHHHDHVGGNALLKERYGCKIYASEYDTDRIPGIDHVLNDGDSIRLGNHAIEVIATPGHTLGHIVYYFKDDDCLFCGDTVFAMGCGRLFEGKPEVMWQSLKKIRALPDRTRIYCAHEYTLNNAEFAHSVLPGEKIISERLEFIQNLRKHNIPTIPSNISLEKQTNPFLMADSESIRNQLNHTSERAETCFAYLRKLKDSF